LHKHPYQEIFIIQAGLASFTVDSTVLEAHAGQIVIVPADVPHKFVDLSDQRLKQIDIHVNKQGSPVLGGKRPKHEGHYVHKGGKGAYLTGGFSFVTSPHGLPGKPRRCSVVSLVFENSFPVKNGRPINSLSRTGSQPKPNSVKEHMKSK
jgi:hypothetical protein